VGDATCDATALYRTSGCESGSREDVAKCRREEGKLRTEVCRVDLSICEDALKERLEDDLEEKMLPGGEEHAAKCCARWNSSRIVSTEDSRPCCAEDDSDCSESTNASSKRITAAHVCATASAAEGADGSGEIAELIRHSNGRA
jgi:hypothetical protein